MLVPVNTDKRMCLALAIPGINCRADVKVLRNALMEMLDVCISDEEIKDVTSSRAMHSVLNVVCELTKDLEDKERGE
jgi:hypothetical protein